VSTRQIRASSEIGPRTLHQFVFRVCDGCWEGCDANFRLYRIEQAKDAVVARNDVAVGAM
jgi:hypothetical protein